jgi:transcriptional regulator with XRE-family HTH domain
MKNEQNAFGERLRAALRGARLGESPSELVRLLARFGGEPVSPQAVSGWLKGRAMPRQANLRALAKLLSMEPQQLQYGEDGRRAREPRQGIGLDPLDQLALETFLGLSATQRKLIRNLIDELSRGGRKRGVR